MARALRLEHAQLDWNDAAPHALAYDDIYFSRDDGLRETEHVFINSNRLPERFAQWHLSRPFVVAETGFGSGLNMLHAWACFEAHAPHTARLHLVSVEKHPFTREDLLRALSAWPTLAERSTRLIAQWPAPVSGVHRIVLAPRVTLDVHFGEATECFEQLDGQVDAWFLDGFAPAKNPAMWTQALFDAMAVVSRPGATFATFTCAGLVKRGLIQAGFHCEKIKGFGRKREMLRGSIATPPTDRRRMRTPWFTPPPVISSTSAGGDVAVIGAGIAGASTAHALARRGRSVMLFDTEAPGAGGSGNRQGALYVKLAAHPNPQSRFYLAALQYTTRWLAQFDPERRLWSDCGVLQLALSDKEATRQRTFLSRYDLPEHIVHGVDVAGATQRAGTALSSNTRGGLYYPGAGWVRPKALCQALAATDGITFHQGLVVAIEFIGTAEAPRWRLRDSDGRTFETEQVVVATAQASNRFEALAHLPLQSIRGQVSQVAVPDATLAPKCVVCAGGYTPPPWHGVQSFGATFAPHDTALEMRPEDHTANLAELERALPDYAAALGRSFEAFEARVGLRCASPDKSPLVGPAPVAEAWCSDYAALAHDARRIADVPGRHWPGLWISVAHGSRGLVSAPLCAELLASRICDEPMPLTLELADHLHPGRRLITDLIRTP